MRVSSSWGRKKQRNPRKCLLLRKSRIQINGFCIDLFTKKVGKTLENLFIAPVSSIIMTVEKISETFFSRRLFIQVSDVYTGTSDIANVVSGLGAKEIENLYETDGPRKRASYVAELVKLLDRNSRLKILFDAKGDSTLNTLTLDIRAEFQTRSISTEGVMMRTFTEYYMTRVAPFLRKLAEQELIGIWNSLEYQIKLRFKYSYA
jgi:hypothetical protein